MSRVFLEMGMASKRTFVGFGFGAIQAGLFLYEVQRPGAFGRLVVAEVVPEIVEDVRRAGGIYALNIAHADHIEQAQVGPVELENPTVPADRARLIDAIAQAEMIVTAVPSVKYYQSAGPASLDTILAAGLERKIKTGGSCAVIYAAENHRNAAALLLTQVMDKVAPAYHAAVRRRVCFVDTVIGKMSGVAVGQDDLLPITPDVDRAFLVESFNHTLISRIEFATIPEEDAREDYVSPTLLPIFEQKADLHPFEEAKLYGHNAVHALGAYLGRAYGIEFMSQLPTIPGMLDFLRAALLDESGKALCGKYAGIDEFFTPTAIEGWADDVLARIVNPHLQDSVDRVGRDPARKLGWNDRLIGPMRLARERGITPHRYALGTAAALDALGDTGPVAATLRTLWQADTPGETEALALITLIEQGQQRLRQWQASDFPNLETLIPAI